MTYSLNFPEFEFSYRTVGETRFIFDPLRRRYVKLTPEEWVRQNLAQFLIQDRGCPRGLIAVESGFEYQGMPCRADLMVGDRRGRPLLIAECKAPEIRLTQRAFEQVGRYNAVLKAPYLAVSNGTDHFCCRIDRHRARTIFLDSIPSFDEMIAWSERG